MYFTIRATIMVNHYYAETQRFLHISPSAVLVLLWNYLMYTHYILVGRFVGGTLTETLPTSWYKYGFIVINSSGYFIFGLLADVWIGRYKAILIGIVLCFISWIIIGIGQLHSF